jgi:signal transduction histidine kinase
MTNAVPAVRRVLLVEDDVELREAMADALTSYGIDVTAVDDGREGLRLMRLVNPDVVVLDLMMPVMDGWQFRIEQRRDPAIADTPVVVMSASHSATAAAVDADLFISKPCSVTTLIGAIDEVLAIRRRRDEPIKQAQADRMAALGTLAAGVVHEINNPLTYVLLHLSQAKRQLRALAENPTAPRAERFELIDGLLGSAIEGAERIREITRGVRTFSRIEGRASGAIDVREPLAAALDLVATDLRYRARLNRVDRGVPFVNADEGRLAQVFLNLLSNAVQALPEAAADQHEIRVSTFTDAQGRAVVEVSDTGKGIAPHDLPHIFEPFFTTKPVGEGTGLGLSISHGIVRGYGGEIEVVTELGEGTTFRVILPPAHAAEQATAERLRILLVDGDPATHAAVHAAVDGAHDVQITTTAQKAIEQMTAGDHDVVLCDLRLRGLGGIDLHERLRAVRPRVAGKLVYLTSGNLTEGERDFLDHHPHLAKPVNADELREMLGAGGRTRTDTP